MEATSISLFTNLAAFQMIRLTACLMICSLK